jgi:hypothetical protein
MPQLPTLEKPGWTSFGYTLMQGDAGAALLVCDTIIKDYLNYLTTCRKASRPSLSFSDWIQTPQMEFNPRSAAL